MRAMFLEFLDDPTTHHLDQQFMLGPSLLVAPSFVPETEETAYYLPAGRWTSFYHPDRVVQGPMWMREKIPLEDIALWVRQGTVLVMGPKKIGRPDYDYDKNLGLTLYEIEDGETVEVNIPTGKAANIAGSLSVKRRDSDMVVSVASGHAEIRSVILHIAGMEIEGSQGGLINLPEGSHECQFRVKSL